MKAAITTKEVRETGTLIFDINQNSFDNKQTRLITKERTLIGSILTTDWGIDNDKEINFEINMDEQTLEKLQAIHINPDISLMFAYRNDLYTVILISCNEKPLRDRYMVQIRLTVLSKVQQSD